MTPKDDAAEAAARREAHAKNISLVGQLAASIDGLPPLVDWGWTERHASPWAPQFAEALATTAGRATERNASLAWAQFAARMRKLVSAV